MYRRIAVVKWRSGDGLRRLPGGTAGQEAPQEAPEEAVRYYPPGVQTRWFLGPGGRLQRGVLRLRTSEFWKPVPGDLEAKNLDSLEDYSLVAKNVLSTAWWPHKGAGGFLYIYMVDK